MKCAQAGCLEISFLVFIAFVFIAATLDMDIVILGVQNLSFGVPGASTLPPLWPLCQLEGAVGAMSAAGRTRRSPEPDFQ